MEKNINEKNKINKKILLIIILIICVALAVGLISTYNRVKEEKKREEYRNIESNEFNYMIYPAPAKPIIYLYPEKEQNIKVKLLKKEDITCSYPKYEDGWYVKAKPNGDLKDLDSGKDLYSLYYESKSTEKCEIGKEGFIVKNDDVVNFLEEKLDILGLNYKEKEEFIVYWLPKLEANKYNYIRFATLEEINENMPLEINPKPDSLIRILMIYKGLEEPIKVKEQELTRAERIGYSVVEWGGTEIK